jgi:putative hemolysin
MEPPDLWMLALLLVCLLLSAFFSSAETAFIAIPRIRLLHLIQTGHPRATLVSHLIQRPEKLLATILLSNNLVNTAAAALGTAIALSLIQHETLAILVATAGVTALLLVFSETLPKTIAWHRAEPVALAWARPLSMVQIALAPGIWVLQEITTLFTRLLGITPADTTVRDDEIRTMIAVGAKTGGIEAAEATLLEKVFRFGDQQVREVMTPRPEIVWLAQGTSLAHFLSVYSTSSHTRFPIYEGTYENIVGVLSNKDVLLALGRGELKPEDSVTGMLRTAYFVPETKAVGETFAEMQQDRHSLLIAVDEFGSIAGLATRKQLLGVIVGEASGEDDDLSDEDYTTIDKDTFSVTAGVGVSEINEKLGLNIPEGEYQTVAGFILDQLGYIPDSGEILDYEGLQITIKKMNGVRIETVEVRRLPLALDEVAE